MNNATFGSSNKRIKKLSVLLASAAVGLMFSAPAYAQVDEIIVTARKTQESLQDVPIAVTAFTGDFFQDSGLVEFADIGKLTPNFDVQENAVSGSGFSNITIRGQTALNRELSSDQAVGITINGAPITRGTNLFSNLFDVEQVEVLKGPQGTLFGKNTTGGAVVVTTTAPKLGVFEAYIEADVGNFDRADLEAVANVGGETWAVRFGAAIQSRDGFGFGVRGDGNFFTNADGNVEFSNPDGTLTGDEFADDGEVFYKASVLFEPNDQLSVRMNVDYHEVDESLQGNRILNDGPLDLGPIIGIPSGIAFLPVAVATPTALGPFAASQQQLTEPTLDADEFNINATINYDFGAVNLTSITSYRDQFLFLSNPFAGAAIVDIGQESDIFAQELRLNGEALDDRLKWQVGGFYADESGVDRDDVGALRRTNSDNETKAVFAQGTFAITDKLNFTGGLRYTEEDRAVGVLLETRPTGDLVVPQQEVSFNGTSWTAGVDYKIQDDILGYATISRGFRSGGIDDERLNLIVDGATVDGVFFMPTVDDITIQPEFVTNYEVGFKADFFNNTLRWNSAGFYSDYENIQVQTFDPVLLDSNNQAVQTIANGAQATLYGFESELNYVPNDKLSLGATVGYTFGEFDEFTQDDISTGTLVVIDRSDEALGGPEWQASAFARYEDDISDNIRAGAQLNYSYRGTEELLGGADVASFADQSQADLDSYGIFNGQIDFDIESLGTNIAFYGRNLLDNDHDTTGFALFTLGLPLAQRNPGAPRTYGVRVRKSF